MSDESRSDAGVEPAETSEQLSGDWRRLYDWLVLDPNCPPCDAKEEAVEALAIVNAARLAQRRSEGQGCIASSLTAMTYLQLGLGSHAVAVTTGNVSGTNWFSTRTTRTWMEIETHCYRIEMVAWWWGFFRHQAVLLWPKCHRDGFDNRFATVIDLWGPSGRVWQPWSLWSGGMDEVGVSCGRVRDGF